MTAVNRIASAAGVIPALYPIDGRPAAMGCTRDTP